MSNHTNPLRSTGFGAGGPSEQEGSTGNRDRGVRDHPCGKTSDGSTIVGDGAFVLEVSGTVRRERSRFGLITLGKRIESIDESPGLQGMVAGGIRCTQPIHVIIDRSPCMPQQDKGPFDTVGA